MNILAIEPYYGGSHRDFLDRAVRLSAHQWTLATAQPRHWKWRMRSSPLALTATCLDLARKHESLGTPFDAILCSDMLDLPAWLAFISRAQSTSDPWRSDPSQSIRRLLDLPVAVYFHESQWDYPLAPGERIDHHYGYTNLLSAAVSNACWFNSRFHRDVFLSSSKRFIDRMPDGHGLHDLNEIESKSNVIPPGFQPTAMERSQPPSGPIRIGWVARWEHDKRPDVFAQLLNQLDAQGISFQLVLLGPRRGNEPALRQITDRYHKQILVNQYAASREQYVESLSLIDVVVSTADHEFFGIGICEAIDAGAAPVLPNRLSYPELIPGQECFDGIDQAVDLILRLTDSKARRLAAITAKQSIQRFSAEPCIARLDSDLEQMVRQH